MVLLNGGGGCCGCGGVEGEEGLVVRVGGCVPFWNVGRGGG